MKKLNVLVTYSYELEIDENNSIVKEYSDTQELVDHLADYRFNTLPVLSGGVKVMDISVHDIDILDKVAE